MNLKGLLGLLSVLFFAVLFSCTKLNESTNLGEDLIPAVDNVNTFDTTLEVNTAYYPFDDSVKHFISENMAVGQLNDPVFGPTTADMYFNLSSTVYGNHPFTNKDTPNFFIDSVVLSLAYQFGYGDTTAASQLTVQVSEIQNNNGFVDTLLYRYDSPSFSTTGGVLGTQSFSVRQLNNDSVKIGLKRDTVKIAKTLRIRLNNSLGEKLRNFDTTANGAYKNDSLFRKAFRGLAVKATSAAGIGTLAYFNLSASTNTRLLVYYRYQKNGVKDTTAAVFTHATYSQANSIRRTPGGSYLANLSNPSSQNLYIQSSPQGSYVGLKIPKLDNFPNKVIHRAELIAYKLDSGSPSDNLLSTPPRLFLDHKGARNDPDSAYAFDNDLQLGADGSVNYASFGGNLRSDNTYRFNLTRYVQGIVTRRERNDSLRLYAPLRTSQYSRNLGGLVLLTNMANIATGRVVVGGGTPATPQNVRMRLRVIYSNL